MNVLVVGSGGREHALAWKLAQSADLGELHAAPGNPGIARHATCHPVRAEDAESLLGLCRQCGIDLVVIGPEAPLVSGVADNLRHGGVTVFGPSGAAAMIEGSKSFAKDVMKSAGVPTARELVEPVAPCVIKADGLAAGKGVFVCRTDAEVETAWPRAQALGDRVVVEELLEGEEVSLFALCDGAVAVALPAAQDAKRLRDGDEGPNTGGMGAYAPLPFLSARDREELVEAVHGPVLDELAKRGSPFVGLLYAGLMLTEDGARTLEFNCRFGDPETQAILPLLEGDLLDALAGAARGDLAGASVDVADGAAATVVLAAPGYPDAPEVGSALSGIEEAETAGGLVFHAGTALRDGALLSAGGRVLNVTAVGPSLSDAREQAYAALDHIRLDGAQFRTDIGARTVAVAR
ncbi:MAG TPA: phosphoribosylamine--glycine ligase [Gaiellaceae bacterium]|jgi:phosphoribosylamine--glycine ligase|nr:phosphoribosylamine--glycine ligase [Gaiellaceae bacterium]